MHDVRVRLAVEEPGCDERGHERAGCPFPARRNLDVAVIADPRVARLGCGKPQTLQRADGQRLVVQRARELAELPMRKQAGSSHRTPPLRVCERH
jgi:hypothetical protein